jgi:hypothetical protein
MRRIVLVTLVLVVTAGHAMGATDGWKTFRSEQFGWEISYPPDMVLTAHFGGQSGDLRDAASGATLAELEVWPSDLCPRERPGATAEGIGMERVSLVTQADGDDGSSFCGPPMTVRRFASDHDVPLYEVRLTCSSERIVGRRTVRRQEGRKGPTFFSDVSQRWRQRVLMVDPIGVDPRLAVRGRPPDIGSIRSVLATLTTFALPEPDVRCIDDPRPGGVTGTLVIPPSRR